MDTQATLRELLDRRAIEELIHNYCERFDRNDPEGVAALFTANARIDYNPDTPTLSGAELAASISVGLRELFAATSHHVSNIQIRFEGADKAHALSYVHAWHRYHGDAPDGYLWGRYRHAFLRTAEGWRITSLRLEGAGTQDFHRERMHPIGRQR
jgi:ketosteroid isomerase-like protein